MRVPTIAIPLALGLILSIGVFSAIGQPHEGIALNIDAIPWHRVAFRSQHPLVTVSTRLDLSLIPWDAVAPRLLSAAEGVPVMPSTTDILAISVTTAITPALRSGANITNDIWIDPKTSGALGRRRIRLGDDDFDKHYRFAEGGVFRHRVQPKDKEEIPLGPEKWTDIRDTFYPYGAATQTCPLVTDRVALIVIASATLTSAEASPMTLCAFGKRGLHEVVLTPEGVTETAVDYEETGPQGIRDRREERSTIKVRLTSRLMETGSGIDETFSLLGFQKDIVLFIDPAHRLPVRIDGHIAYVGQVSLGIGAVDMRPGQ
jgi:hypothetical protein